MRTIGEVVEYLRSNGEREHEALRKEIFEAGGNPDSRMFRQILQSREIERTVVKNDDGSATVIYKAKDAS